jgi:hypothetical protein
MHVIGEIAAGCVVVAVVAVPRIRWLLRQNKRDLDAARLRGTRAGSRASGDRDDKGG